MACATYSNGARRASWSSRPCNEAGAPSLIFIPNASTQGPPTSSAVQVNLESPVAVTGRFRSTELEARPRLALARFHSQAFSESSAFRCQSSLLTQNRISPRPRQGNKGMEKRRLKPARCPSRNCVRVIWRNKSASGPSIYQSAARRFLVASLLTMAIGSVWLGFFQRGD